MALAREVMPSIPENALVLGDRYFPSFFFLAELRRRGIHGIFPGHAARDVDFRRGKWLSYGDHAVVWEKLPQPVWMPKKEHEAYPGTIEMGEIEVHEKRNDRQRLVLVTALVDDKSFSKTHISRMYRKRWRIEIALRDNKNTFGLDRINAKTPAMIEKVIWTHALAYNMLHWYMLNACILYEVEVEHVSVKGAATILTVNAALILAANPDDLPRFFSLIYKQIVEVPLGKRSDTEEPRAIKRRPKARALLKESKKSWHEPINR